MTGKSREQILTSSRLAIGASCALGACALGAATLIGMNGTRRWFDWAAILLLFGVPTAVAAAGAIGTLRGRRWGLVAARVVAAVTAVLAGIACLILIVLAVLGLLYTSGDAAPPGIYILMLAPIPGVIAALAFALHRAAGAELGRWDAAAGENASA